MVRRNHVVLRKVCWALHNQDFRHAEAAPKCSQTLCLSTNSLPYLTELQNAEQDDIYQVNTKLTMTQFHY
jgi:hypothetical protein